MCPLRVILIFLSATLAGFFVLRNLTAPPEFDADETDDSTMVEQVPLSTKVGSVICGGFWTFVDMASGRYLWRTLMAPDAAVAEKEKKNC